jgi:hypothetical protein
MGSEPSNKTKEMNNLNSMNEKKKGRPVVKNYDFMNDKYVTSWLQGLSERTQARAQLPKKSAALFQKGWIGIFRWVGLRSS